VPTYSYACTACDNKFDTVQAFTDDALTTCPQCSGRLRKLFNSVGVVFKGSGFYRNDSRETAKSPSAGGSESSSGSKSGSESGSKSGSESGSKSGSESGSKSAPEKSPEKSAAKPAEKSAPAPAATS